MDLVIRDLPAKLWENLDKKAKASGRTVEAEAAAILEDAVSNVTPPGDLDDVQKMVWDMYGGKLPKNEVDRFLADRKREARAEAAKLG